MLVTAAAAVVAIIAVVVVVSDVMWNVLDMATRDVGIRSATFRAKANNITEASSITGRASA